jgi:hypothetical protein
MHDLVYPLNPGPIDFDELRYSLRSVETNTRVERIFFLGGKPKWLRTGLHIKTKQPYDKLRNARVQLQAALDSTEVSDPFFWMNDDMYLLEDVGEDMPLWHGGSFQRWLADLGPRFNGTEYMRCAQLTIKALRTEADPEIEPLSWSLHTPLLVNKRYMQQALDLDARYDQKLHLRTAYGGLAAGWLAPVAERSPFHDVKGIAAPAPGQVYASSANATWPTSKLGKAVRAKFPKPSCWER